MKITSEKGTPCKGRETRLYNVMFPIWLLCAFPIAWIVVLPANLLIDGVVIAITLKVLKSTPIKPVFKKSLFLIWIFGFLSDILGGVLMFLPMLIPNDNGTALGLWWDENMATDVAFNCLANPFAFLWVLVCTAVSAALIYFLNLKVSLKNAPVTPAVRKKLALSLAIFTAPYLFFLPSMWFYTL